jgi:hypothetical protein
MRKFFTLFAVIASLWAAPSSAQMSMMGVSNGPSSGDGGCSTSTFDLDGTPQWQNATATSVTTPAFSTSFCNNLVVVGILTNSTVTSVTDRQGHLTFTKRSALGGGNDVEIWTAPLSDAALSGDTIAANVTTSAFTTVSVSSFSGYSIASAFDTNGALPSAVSGSGLHCSFTTSNANDILYGFSVQTAVAADAGWNLIISTSVTGFLFGEYKIVSATQAGSTATTLVDNSVCDAIQKGP